MKPQSVLYDGFVWRDIDHVSFEVKLIN